MAKAPVPGRTTPSRQKPKPKSDVPGLLIGFDGAEWEFYSDAITPKDLADLRRATGLTSTDVFQAMADGNIPLDAFGALVFLARRQSEGKWINFEHATDGLTLGATCTINPIIDETPADDSPEA